MAHSTRREFLLKTTAAAGLLGIRPFHSLWAEEPEAPVIAVPEPASMSISRWDRESAPDSSPATIAEKLTRSAIESLGGMKRFVSSGDVVWIKPNIGWDRTPEQAANTNPDVVATLIRLCLDAGAKKVKVGDRSCNDPRQAYANSGIEAATRLAGGEVVYLDDKRYREMEIKGSRLDKWQIYPEIVETDLVINVPIVKHHGLSEATLCMKNYMGVAGGARHTWHQNMAECLADVTAFMKPRLCVLDAFRILLRNGPTGGKLEDVKQMDTVAAGTDIVALDAFGSELLGHTFDGLETVKHAASVGLGTMDYKTLSPVETRVA